MQLRAQLSHSFGVKVTDAELAALCEVRSWVVYWLNYPLCAARSELSTANKHSQQCRGGGVDGAEVLAPTPKCFVRHLTVTNGNPALGHGSG